VFCRASSDQRQKKKKKKKQVPKVRPLLFTGYTHASNSHVETVKYLIKKLQRFTLNKHYKL
jgi:hypothetical protein